MSKRILITGGNGFLGSALAKHLSKDSKYKKYDIIISSRNNEKNYEVSNITKCFFAPMDVSNIESVRDILYKFKPEIIIHAAATKYVQLSELFPFECVDTNINGSVNIARVSKEIKCKIVIGISTDKSAQPINNIYGFSKAIMERIFLSQNNINGVCFSCVRFGNIAWSSGSVFPIWKKMTEKDNLILTTGPDMNRFIFSINEATDLVIRCLKNIKITNGRILSIKMKSTKIKKILEIWKYIYKTKWKTVDKRIGDKDDEYLISENEIPYTKEINLDKKIHFLISFNKKVKNSIKYTYSTKNADKLSSNEIKKLLTNKYD